MTSDLKKRIQAHKTGKYDSFTKNSELNKIVYFEEIKEINVTLDRERKLKTWKKEWKLDLIKESNPELLDLTEKFLK